MEKATLLDPEIVVGIVGRMGTDTSKVSAWIRQSLNGLKYESIEIKVTKYLKTLAMKPAIVEKPIEKRYISYIKACNSIRELAKNADNFFLLQWGRSETQENY